MNGRCQRCYKETNITIGSMFDESMICMDCKKKEEAHSSYEEARKKEAEEVRKENYNYRGIGKPSDL